MMYVNRKHTIWSFDRPTRFKEYCIEKIYRKSRLYWDSTTNEVKLFSQKNKSWKSIYKLKIFDNNQMYVDELKHFFKCIKSNKKTINDIDDGIKTLRVVLSAKKSSESGKLIII